MSVLAPPPSTGRTEPPSERARPARGLVVASALVWTGLTAIAWWLIDRYGLPFAQNRPLNAAEPDIQQLIGLQIGALVAGVMVALTWLLTLRRRVPPPGSLVPDRAIAVRELRILLGYGLLVQAAGLGLGALAGWHPISLHLAGTLYGLADAVSPAEAVGWAAYNGIAYALIPYLALRRRGYSNRQLNLVSHDRRADLKLIATLLVFAAGSELLGLSGAIFELSPRQIALGGTLSLVLNLVGTSLPILVFIYAILLPRYAAVTRSPPAAMVAAALTYAAVHALESWATWDSWYAGVLSIIFVLLQYVPPGFVKAYITVRSGNAWVHLWAYHSISPHVTIDTPNFVEIFRIQR